MTLMSKKDALIVQILVFVNSVKLAPTNSDFDAINVTKHSFGKGPLTKHIENKFGLNCGSLKAIQFVYSVIFQDIVPLN